MICMPTQVAAFGVCRERMHQAYDLCALGLTLTNCVKGAEIAGFSF